MTDQKPKIFVFAVPTDKKRGIDPLGAEPRLGIEHYHGDCMGYAVAEDGAYLTDHLPSSIGWFRHDMGLTGTWKHEQYREHYPDGYELVEVPTAEIKTHPGLVEAMRLNKLMAEKEEVTTP